MTRKHDHWATPKEFYDKLNSEFNFEFDPCPLNSSFNGLEINWKSSNFVNPPYSRELKEAFINKGLLEAKNGNTSVFLLPVSTSTKIFHEVILPNAEIRFIRRRLRFLEYGDDNRKSTTGTKDLMLVIFRGNKYGTTKNIKLS